MKDFMKINENDNVIVAIERNEKRRKDLIGKHGDRSS